MGITIEEIPEYRKNRLREYIRLAKLVKNSDENQKTSLGLRVSDYNDAYHTRTRIRARIEELNRILRDANYNPETSNSKEIDIGSKFSVLYPDGETESYTLVTGLKNIYNDNYVSQESHMGQAIIGKKAGDQVEFKTGYGKIKLTIQDVQNIRSKWHRFIREKAKAERMSPTSKAELEVLKNTNPEEYKKRHQYTFSQKLIIEDEIERLNNSKNINDIDRKNALEKYLADNTIAKPPEDDTIGVGSIVKLKIFNGDQQEMRTFELINEAVSTEMTLEYIERFSIVGEQLYGKKADDIVTINRDNQPPLIIQIEEVDNKRYSKLVYQKHI